MRPSESGQLRDTRHWHRPHGLCAASSVHTASQARVSTRHECQFSKHGEIQVPNWPHVTSQRLIPDSRGQQHSLYVLGSSLLNTGKVLTWGTRRPEALWPETWSHRTLFLPVSNNLFSIPQGHNSTIIGPCHRASSSAVQLVFSFSTFNLLPWFLISTFSYRNSEAKLSWLLCRLYEL